MLLDEKNFAEVLSTASGRFKAKVKFFSIRTDQIRQITVFFFLFYKLLIVCKINSKII